jgi:rSAM/selenodomain-associated transferase 1
MKRRTVLVFLKYPQAGRVKTRLAEFVGPEQAASLYRDWIGIVFGQLESLRSNTRLVGYFDGASAEAFAEWQRLADEWWPQPSGDLGDRLIAGLARGFDAGGPVLAVGTDCLEMGPALIEQAFEGLARTDVVFGPTPDGGYYLVGMAAFRPALFRSVRWSSSYTLSDHLLRCREEGWSVSSLPMRHDIDTWQDWLAYLARNGRPTGGEVPEPGGRHSDPQ